MKITTLNNSEIIIQANGKKADDWQNVKKVAELMIENASIELVACSSCEDEQWFHLTTCYGNYQAADIKGAYECAKKLIK